MLSCSARTYQVEYDSRHGITLSPPRKALYRLLVVKARNVVVDECPDQALVHDNTSIVDDKWSVQDLSKIGLSSIS